MTLGRRAVALLLLAAALVLATLGQHYFFHRQDYLWDGLVLHGLAVLCFALAWRQTAVRGSQPGRLSASALHWHDWACGRAAPAAWMSLGLVLSIAATFLARDRVWHQATNDVVMLWLLGMASAMAAVLWPNSWPPRLTAHWRARISAVSNESWFELATVAGLTALAFSLRVAVLGRVPYTLGGDEAWHGLLARQVLHGELRNPFIMGYMSMPTFFYWPMSWSLRLAGDTVTGLRLPAALAGTATVLILYLFAKRLWGRRVALLGSAFLATYDYHIHYSRLGANNIWDPLLVLLTLWPLDVGLSSTDEVRRARFFSLSGLMMGLSLCFYTGARLLPLLVAANVAFSWFKTRRHAQPEGPGVSYAWPLLLLFLAFLVAAAPMLSFALSHPAEWNARINQVGILQSGWLAREPGLTGKTTGRILAEQFIRASGAFHVYADRTVWYGADRPLLGFFAGAFALLGSAWALLHWRERRHFLLLTWFWGVIIAGGMLTESPPSSQRLVMAIPAVALLVAIGLEQTVALLGRVFGPKPSRWQDAALGALALALAVSNVRFYFVEFTPSHRYGSENGETATMIGYYLREMEGSRRAYFFGAPRIYWSFGTMSFLAPDVLGVDVDQPLAGPLEFTPQGEPVVFLFLPERVGEIEWVRQAFPDGRVREFHDASGRLRFVAYETP